MNERTHCPYLGLRQNRAIRFASPTSEHRCYVSGDAQEIPVDQRLYCLSINHLSCPLYTGEWSGTTTGVVANAGTLALPSRGIWGRLSNRDRAFYFTVLGLLVTITLVWLGIGYLYTLGSDNGASNVPPVATATATLTIAPATATQTATATPSSTPTLTATPTLTPTLTATPTLTPTLTFEPTQTPVVIIIVQTPTTPPLPPSPTPIPTEATPTIEPAEPTPTFMPTDTPYPTDVPTLQPAPAPTDAVATMTTGTSFVPLPTLTLPTEFLPTPPSEWPTPEPSSVAEP